jgi:ribosomal protein L44E
MSEDKITINLECPKCHVAPHVDDESNDESAVYCPNCNAQFGTFVDVKAKARDAAKDKMQEMLRDAFKGRKGWSIK